MGRANLTSFLRRQGRKGIIYKSQTSQRTSTIFSFTSVSFRKTCLITFATCFHVGYGEPDQLWTLSFLKKKNIFVSIEDADIHRKLGILKFRICSDKMDIIWSTMLDLYSFKDVSLCAMGWMQFCLPRDCKHRTKLESDYAAFVSINPDSLPPSSSDLWSHHFVKCTFKCLHQPAPVSFFLPHSLTYNLCNSFASAF